MICLGILLTKLNKTDNDLFIQHLFATDNSLFNTIPDYYEMVFPKRHEVYSLNNLPTLEYRYQIGKGMHLCEDNIQLNSYIIDNFPIFRGSSIIIRDDLFSIMESHFNWDYYMHEYLDI